MKRKSHYALGCFLLERYMPGLPKCKRMLFLYGCMQPDQNPLTYLKGSLHGSFLRGHNYENANRFLFRLCRRLETRSHLYLWDYYTFGKMIHYTQDSFTFAHNEPFPRKLRRHRRYEHQLQNEFLSTFPLLPVPDWVEASDLTAMIRRSHNVYMSRLGNPARDSDFAFRVSCLIAKRLAPKR